jgi:hypothetical protein
MPDSKPSLRERSDQLLASYLESLALSFEASRPNRNLRVHRGEDELQVEIYLGTRKQTVNVSLKWVPSSRFHCLRLISRACVAQDHRKIRAALEANSSLELGALCMDTSTNPPVIDVTYTLVAEDSTCDEILHALFVVAQHADNIEKRATGRDVF